MKRQLAARAVKLSKGETDSVFHAKLTRTSCVWYPLPLALDSSSILIRDLNTSRRGDRSTRQRYADVVGDDVFASEPKFTHGISIFAFSPFRLTFV